METILEGLIFPTSPVSLSDGSALVAEIGTGLLTQVFPDRTTRQVANLGGGPAGAAIGPDGAIYVCKSGGGLDCRLRDGVLSVSLAPERYAGGSIQRVDLVSGKATTLYTSCDNIPLLSPWDLAFDASGGFWFTDHGTATSDAKVYGGIYYARPDGSAIRRVRQGLLSPNGIGLSPDGKWLYWADSTTTRLWRAAILQPGMLADYEGAPGDVVATAAGNIMLTGLAVEANGRVCIGTLWRGGITVADPENGSCEHVPLEDFAVTNLCFGSRDAQEVWITAAGSGRLLRGRWPRPGLPLAFAAGS